MSEFVTGVFEPPPLGAPPELPTQPIPSRTQLYSVGRRGGVKPVGEPLRGRRLTTKRTLYDVRRQKVPERPESGAGPAATVAPPERVERAERVEPGLAVSSRTMAIASAVSRLTGFVRQIALTAAIGLGLIGDAYNTANYLPNIVYELLLGGVLTSVVVPLLVSAQQNDDDGGEAYAQRLVSLTAVVLTAATVVTIVLAPWLVHLFGIGAGHTDQSRVAILLARILLPEIVFYGLGAIIGAILNTRGVFGPPVWAPVLNNVVVIATAAVFFVMPGPHTLTVGSMTTAQILVLGIGTTLGIVVQTVVLLPAVRRIGFRWRWRLDVRGAGLGREGRLLAWVVGYVVISQIGYAVIVRLANHAQDTSGVGYAVYANVALLFQMPYGIIGVALLTALLPRMSRAAASGDDRRLIEDLSLGGRLTATGLIPVTAAFIVLGPSITVTVFAHGHSSVSDAHAAGVALAWSAFGLLPFALTLLQLRAFYAVKDARTPTLINLAMVAIRVGLCLLVPTVVADRHIVAGLAVANSLSFVPGLVLGDVLLRRRFGPLGTGRLIRTVARLVVASAAGGIVAWAVLIVVTRTFGDGRIAATGTTLVGCLAGGLVALGAALRLRVEEMQAVLTSVRSQLGR